MYIKHIIKNFRDESGQTLFIVAGLMLIATVVGVSIAVRTLNTTSNVSSTDTATRALAAAEACVERFLVLSNQALDDAKDPASGCPPGTTGVAGVGCEMILSTNSADDPLDTKATATVNDYGAVTPTEYLTVDIEKDQVVETSLSGYPSDNDLRVCWSALGVDPAAAGGETHSDLYFIVYGTRAGAHQTYQIGVNAQDPEGLPYNTNFDSASGSDIPNGYNSCYTLDWPNGTFNSLSAVRVMALNYDSTIGVRPIGANLPYQGYEITCVGELSNVASAQKVTRTVSVHRSYPFMPGLFDFGIYSQGDI